MARRIFGKKVDSYPGRNTLLPADTHRAIQIPAHAENPGRIVAAGGWVGPDGLTPADLWTPEYLGPKLAAWFKADAITGLADTAGVTTWIDSSGNRNHATQNTTANKPTYRTNQINGLPVVDFDGTDDWMATLLSGSVLDESILAVAQKDSLAGTGSILGPSAAGGRVLYTAAITGKPGYAKDNFAVIADAALFAITANTPGIIEGNLGVGSALLGVNGSVETFTHAQTLTPGLTSLLGINGHNSQRWNGLMAEVVVTQPAMTDDERRRVEGYLAHKWGTTASLPSDHPYKTTPPLALLPYTTWNIYSNSADEPNAWRGRTGLIPFSTPWSADVPGGQNVEGSIEENSDIYHSRISIPWSGTSPIWLSNLSDGALRSGAIISVGANHREGALTTVTPNPADLFVAPTPVNDDLILPWYVELEENRPPVVSNMRPRGGEAIPALLPSFSFTVDDPDRDEGHNDYPANAIVRLYEKIEGSYRFLSNTVAPLTYPGDGTAPVNVNVGFGGSGPYGSWRTKVRAWFDASAITGVANGAALATWPDSSGRGFDAWQATTANQPIFRTNRQNGLPGVDFDGVNDFLATALSASSMNETILAVVRMDDFSTPGNILTSQQVIGGRQLWIWTDAALYLSKFGVGNLASRGYVTAGVPILASATTLPTMARASLNGDLPSTIGYVAHSLPYVEGITSVIGADNFGASPFDGDIYEIIVCSNLTDAERQEAEGYLSWKWGITASLPAAHPYKTASPAVKLWEPTELGTKLAGWFAADRITGVTNGTGLAQWDDLSGNGRHAVQATSGNRPIYRTGQANGLPGVDFVSDDYLATSISSSSLNESVFAVVDIDVDTQYHTIIQDPSDQGRVLRIEASSRQFAMWDFSPVYLINITDTNLVVPLNTPTILSETLTPTTVGLGINGTFIAKKHGQSFVSGLTSIIGARTGSAISSFDGVISEIIVANVALTTGERQKVEGYLAHKYGTTTKLPPDHPYKRVPPTTLTKTVEPVAQTLWNPGYATLPRMWLAADAITGLADGAAVSQWNDVSGSNNHATQATGANQPTYRLNQINGMPAVDFDGVNDYFVSPLSASGPFATDELVFAVLIRDTAATGFILAASNSGGRSWLMGGTPLYQEIDKQQMAIIGGATVGAGTNFNSPILMEMVLGNTTWEVGINGIFVTGTHAQTLVAGLTSVIGARIDSGVVAALADMKLGEMIVIPASSVTPALRQQIEGYLAHKWGASIDLPATHPYRRTPPMVPSTSWIPEKVIGPTIRIPAINSVTTMSLPCQMAINSKGVIYIADVGNNQLLVLNGDGTYIIRVTGTLAIYGVWVGPDDSIYIAYGTTLRKYSPTFMQQWSVTIPAIARYLAMDTTNVYVSTGSAIYKYLAATGAAGTPASWGSVGSTNGLFNTTYGVAYNPVDGLVYVVDAGNSRIQVFTTAGVYVRQFPVSSNSRGMAFNSRGEILLATGGIQKLTNTGTFIEWVSTAGNTFGVTPGLGGVVWATDQTTNTLTKYHQKLPLIINTYAWTVEVTDELGGITGTGYGGRQLEAEAPDGTTDFIIQNTGLVS